MLKWLFLMDEASVTMIPGMTAHVTGYVGLSLLDRGLVAALTGLMGTFLVLTLFFITIKLIRRIKARNNEE
ncbi:MAG: hypothetical protein FWF86_04105 [Clostridia bacterium]|nr:hypothetical protein [Clostridia bacterium]